MRIVLVVVAILVALYLLLMVALAIRSQTSRAELGAAGGQLRTCERTTNCVSSREPTGASNRVEPWRYTTSSGEAFARLAAVIEAQPGARIVEREDGVYLRAEFRSRTLRFVDDFEAMFDADGWIHVRSASRVGLADRGVNRRRVRALAQAFHDAGSTVTAG